MSELLAIDPGTTASAWILWHGRIVDHGKWDNQRLLEALRDQHTFAECRDLAIEMMAGYGMSVGQSVFATLVWTGRFIEAWEQSFHTRVWREIYRKDVKLALCGHSSAKDAHVREALIDRVGPVGKKATPGPTYGIVGDEWAALAIAVTASSPMHALAGEKVT